MLSMLGTNFRRRHFDICFFFCFSFCFSFPETWNLHFMQIVSLKKFAWHVKFYSQLKKKKENIVKSTSAEFVPRVIKVICQPWSKVGKYCSTYPVIVCQTPDRNSRVHVYQKWFRNLFFFGVFSWILQRYRTISYFPDSDSLFTLLHTQSLPEQGLPKRSLLYKERICSRREQILSSYSRLLLRSEAKTIR